MVQLTGPNGQVFSVPAAALQAMPPMSAVQRASFPTPYAAPTPPPVFLPPRQTQPVATLPQLTPQVIAPPNPAAPLFQLPPAMQPVQYWPHQVQAGPTPLQQQGQVFQVPQVQAQAQPPYGWTQAPPHPSQVAHPAYWAPAQAPVPQTWGSPQAPPQPQQPRFQADPPARPEPTARPPSRGRREEDEESTAAASVVDARGLKRFLDEASAERESNEKYRRTAPTSNDPATQGRITQLNYAIDKMTQADRVASFLTRHFDEDAEIVDRANEIRVLLDKGITAVGVLIQGTVRANELGPDRIVKAASKALAHDLPDFAKATGFSTAMEDEMDKLEATKPAQAAAAAATSSGDPHRDLICRTCGGRGHITPFCPSLGGGQHGKVKPKPKTTGPPAGGEEPVPST